MRHSIAYAEHGVYAGWPANHGAWQWGDEMLVGFLRGRYKQKSMHNIAEPFEKMHVRSFDGGETWRLEKPLVKESVDTGFNCLSPHRVPPKFSLSRSIIRVCGVYDHGGDECDERGGFYGSNDRGMTWEGPFLFEGIRLPDGMLNTSRTRTLGELVFMSSGQAAIWGTDYTYCARHDGSKFSYVGTVCEDEARAVMPAVARVNGNIFCAMRRRKSGKREGWIDLCVSNDEGESWSVPRFVGVTGSHNGNPPALLALKDGRLLCAFGNRDEGCIVGAVSEEGKLWNSFVIRSSESERVDIGYPQLLMRSDGIPLCFYYWTSDDRPHQHIAVTEVEIP